MTAGAGDVGAVLRGSLAQNLGRSLLAVLAIALGIALGLAVQLINQSAVDELTQSVRTIAGDADLTVRGPRAGFPEQVYAALARDRDVAVASPVVEADVRVDGATEPLRVLGLDLFRAAAIQPGLFPQGGERFDTLRSDTVFLTNAAQRWLGLEPGATLVLQPGLRDVPLRVAGRVPGAGGQRLAVMDIAGAQLALDRLGLVTRVDLRLVPGTDVARFRERIGAALPPGVDIDRPEASLRATESVSRSYRVNLNVLALVALFTGGLLVFTTQALSVVRRRPQFALLRVLGVTRGRLAALVALEGALIGAAGGVVGLAAGYAIARAAVRFAGADLGSGFFRGVEPTVVADPVTFGVFFLLAIAAAVGGSIVPAREAARAAPARALKAGDDESALARLRPAWRGVVVIAAGAVLATLPPVDGLPLAGYAAIAALLIGTLLLMPAASIAILARLPTPRSAPAALALAQLRGAPGQVTVSLAAIVASVSLMVSMAIMVTSFRTSLDEWLGRVLPADLYVRVAVADAGALDEAQQARIASLPGIARIEFLREDQLLLDPARPRVVVLARPLPDREAGTKLPLVEPALARPADAPPALWVNEAMVDLYGFTPGRVVALPIGGREAPFFVAGVWRDYGRPQGAVQLDRSAYVALTGDRSVTNAAVWIAKAGDANAVREAIRGALSGGDRLEIAQPGEIRRLSL
ncbi:MAG TPA: FtsX-like permease family protein, partial [Casimicrobiaceae bacterium]|nr:FtsX-like permease family protein [Casimicrobiaceae bacterium]